MPIRPEYRWLYPIDWPQLSAMIRFARAGGRCEHCGRPHGEIVLHLGDGRWWDAKRGMWRDGQDRPVRSLPRPERHCQLTSRAGRPVWCWPRRIWSMIRRTTGRGTWRRSASGATCSMIAKSTGVVVS